MQSSISSEELYWNLKSKKDFVLLDIRSETEHSAWTIYNSINIPLAKLRNKYYRIPKNKQIVVFCNRGNDSRLAIGILASKGLNAMALKDGLLEWNQIFDPVRLSKDIFSQIIIYQFKRLGKGCLSYILVDHQNNKSYLLDPNLKVEIYENYIKKNNLPGISAVIDTHVHADHVSGGLSASKKYKVNYLLPSQSKVNFKFLKLEKHFQKMLKNIKADVINTPGHTPESCIIVIDKHFAFTGDTLFVDTFGRVDLHNGDLKKSQKEIYNSITQKIFQLNDDIYILPSHSSQTMVPGPLRSASLRYVKRFNFVNEKTTLEEFMDMVNREELPPPQNYSIIKEINLRGKKIKDDLIKELELGNNSCAVKVS